MLSTDAEDLVGKPLPPEGLGNCFSSEPQPVNKVGYNSTPVPAFYPDEWSILDQQIATQYA